MDLSIIIVNWNSLRYLKNCLKSIYASTGDIAVEVIVVDNASYDGSKEFIDEKFPDTMFIQSKENLGFASANNLGFSHSTGSILLFLNPDTEIIGDAVQQMLHTIKSLPDAGAVGCKLLNTDQSVQMSCVQTFPTILNQALDFDFLRACFPNSGLWGVTPLLNDNTQPSEVEVVSGAALMIKKEVFEKTGMFSKEYFMYTEDIDLCYKVKKSGVKVYYTAKGSIVHHGGGSSSRNKINNFSTVMMKESIFRFITRSSGKLHANLYRLSMIPVSLIRLLLITALTPVYLIFKSRSTKNSFCKWTKILRWSVGMEHWAKDLGETAGNK